MHKVLSVDPSICGVRFFNSNQVEGDTQPELAPPAPGALDCNPQVLERLKADQPLLTFDIEPVPLFPNPGGGPRLFIGAPHNSEVTAVGVGGGTTSPTAQEFFELLKM